MCHIVMIMWGHKEQEVLNLQSWQSVNISAGKHSENMLISLNHIRLAYHTFCLSVLSTTAFSESMQFSTSSASEKRDSIALNKNVIIMCHSIIKIYESAKIL